MLVVSVVTDDDTTPNRILTFGVGDAKDHPQYNPPDGDTTIDGNLTFGVGDAKDHPQYNPRD